MSTYLYLVCLDHEPPIIADEESGQQWYHLPQIRKDVANRDAIAAVWREGVGLNNFYRRRTAKFLAQHPACSIGIRTDYGEDVPLVASEDEGVES